MIKQPSNIGSPLQAAKLALGLLMALATILLGKAGVARAESLRSDSYVISFGNFNITSGEKTSETYRLTDTVGQTGAGPYGEYGVSGYFLGGGFQYIYQIKDFSFAISDINIDLGELTVGTHNSDTNQLAITTRGAGGYVVYAYETHPLLHSDNTSTVADTLCDSGSCSETAAGLWTNTSVGGFGFNVNGDDVPADFSTPNHFRQFADASSAESMQAVMSSENIARNAEATVTYKAGLSGNEPAGLYQTAIVYVAVPGY